jgi:nicotinamidase-related amidase
MLTSDETILVLIDVQEKLTAVMDDREALIENLVKLVKALQALGVPVIRLEQNPGRMGNTITPLRELLAEAPALAKLSFSCWGDAAFRQALTGTGRRKVLLAGIETHVCVYQTAADLLAEGYAVEVVADAVASRRAVDKAIGLDRIRACGRSAGDAGRSPLTSVETVIFELLRSAEHPAFRTVLGIVK